MVVANDDYYDNYDYYYNDYDDDYDDDYNYVMIYLNNVTYISYLLLLISNLNRECNYT